MTKKLPVLLLITTLCASSALYGKEQKETPKKIPVIKVIPGIQQISEKKLLKGCLLLGGFAAAITGVVRENHRGNKKYSAYLAATSIQEITQLRRSTESHFRRRNLFVISSALVCLLHLTDLYFHGKKKGSTHGKISISTHYSGFSIHF